MSVEKQKLQISFDELQTELALTELFNSIQFNSIYLRANLTAQRPNTKRARVEKKK
jgi:hypothetical protein